MLAGNPPPRITWSRRGAALPANHIVSDGILEIPRVSPQDAGEYICTGQNIAGSFDVTVYLRVQCKFCKKFMNICRYQVSEEVYTINYRMGHIHFLWHTQLIYRHFCYICVQASFITQDFLLVTC